MKLYLSGEGATDFGQLNQEHYQPGPLALLVDAFIELKTNYSLLQAQAVEYIHKAELQDRAKKIKAKAPSKKNPQKETGYFYKNAKAFAEIIKQRETPNNAQQPNIAILFRDCDGTATAQRGECQAKYESVKTGFKEAGYSNGLAMLAKPKSEAWILCALQGYQHCNALENESGNDNSPNSLKTQLEQKLQQPVNRELLNQLVEQTPIDLNQIDMPMVNQFKQDCTTLLARLGFR
jgi:hypothetical protein